MKTFLSDLIKAYNLESPFEYCREFNCLDLGKFRIDTREELIGWIKALSFILKLNLKEETEIIKYTDNTQKIISRLKVI